MEEEKKVSPEIILRSDLGMPLGKEASQAAHAACALVLGLAGDGMWRESPDSIRAMLGRLRVRDGTAEDMSGALIKITDRGHTVFGGVPTDTTALFASGLSSFQENPHEPKSTDVRMALCVSKKARKEMGGRIAFVEEAARVYALHLLNLLENEPKGAVAEWLREWSSGAFAKITLSAKDDDFPVKSGEIPVSEAKEGMSVLGPAPKAKMDELTGGMRLL